MGWLRDMRSRLTWIAFTRLLGAVGLIYEVAFDKVDRPTVMIVLGAMILGTESIAKVFGRG